MIPWIARRLRGRWFIWVWNLGRRWKIYPLDRVFIGSCTNSRLEDLRAAAKMVEGKHVSKSLKQALVVPGSRVVKAEAEAEGLDKDFCGGGI